MAKVLTVEDLDKAYLQVAVAIERAKLAAQQKETMELLAASAGEYQTRAAWVASHQYRRVCERASAPGHKK